MSHDSLDAVIAAYLLAVEAGEVPNHQELLDQHPEQAEALRAFFADLDRMDRVASPLRMAGELEATGAVEANGPTALPIIRYFGDYELLEEITQGGMGIVYKARQISLNRIVALKMILAGSFASSREVQRFRSEAEAAANLDHPHIVPIYEVGEHEGQQYYSMKFVEGTALAKHPRSDPRREVEGMVAVVRAVYHAHQRGVLHRDLKPSNVLVDSQGTRLVTDFGLAKRLTDPDRSLTEPGQVLGTPKYMAPEQAAGRKDLTVAADVYSLGVILYERLTGQTPFTGDNALTLLRQARESEPPRPSSIQPGLERDLETVVLKCLEKEPNRRYPSAEALADDLDRWLKGEPIQARPVGRLEKTWLWVRRNPALATACGLAAAGLVVVAVASSLAAVQARALAKAERDRREIAQRAQEQATADRDTIEKTFARSLVRPLNPEVAADMGMMGGMGMMDGMMRAMRMRDGDHSGRLNEPELEALWELAEHPGGRLWLRFLDEATEDPLRARQLFARSEPALIAAVGLDAEKRKRAARLLSERLVAPGLQLQGKVDVAFVGLELEDRATPETEAECGMVVEGLAANFPDRHYAWWTRLIAVSARLDPRIAARTLTQALGTETGPSARSSLASSWSEVASRMEPTEAAETLVEALGRETNPAARSSLASALTAVASRMDSPEAAKTLAQALGAETNPHAREPLASALSVVASRMDPIEAARICAQAARTLAQALGAETNPDARGPLAGALSQVATRIVPTDAAKMLVDALGRETSFSARSSLASALAAVASRMEPTEAARVCGGVLRLFFQKYVATTGISVGEYALVSGLLRHLDPARARARTRGVVMSVGSERDTYILRLSEFLDDTSRAELGRRAGLMTMMIGQGASGQLAGVGALATMPWPCRLTTQELVELLKMPTCFGDARRVVLDHLGNRYGRRFVNHWAFVRFAREQNLGLDFTTPPRRLDPKESLERMIKALDRSGDVNDNGSAVSALAR
jgi:hypothetical protein